MEGRGRCSKRWRGLLFSFLLSPAATPPPDCQTAFKSRLLVQWCSPVRERCVCVSVNPSFLSATSHRRSTSTYGTEIVLSLGCKTRGKQGSGTEVSYTRFHQCVGGGRVETRGGRSDVRRRSVPSRRDLWPLANRYRPPSPSPDRGLLPSSPIAPCPSPSISQRCSLCAVNPPPPSPPISLEPAELMVCVPF